MPKQSMPEVLYHYTTAEGLLGILGSRTLWATDCWSLNDAQELLYAGADLAAWLKAKAQWRAQVGRKEPAALADKKYSAHTRAIKMASTRLASAVAPGQPGWLADGGPYLVSFCENGDLLSQWRGYAGAAGYALGFDTSALKSGLDREVGRWEADSEGRPKWGKWDFPKEHDPIELVQVQYGPGARERMIDRIEKEIERYDGRFADEFRIAVSGALSVKDDSFQEESEWRIIDATAYPNESWRAQSGRLIPYVTISFDPKSLREIVVGPGAGLEERLRSAERFTQSRGPLWEHVECRVSSTPFRG